MYRDPRGTFIQLSMLESRSADQDAAREKLLKKNKGDLIGPARAFLRDGVSVGSVSGPVVNSTVKIATGNIVVNRR